MTAAILFAGTMLGLTGSLHCVGMCGPLSLALPTHHLSPVMKGFSMLFYQLGRIITYSVIGLLFGLFGRGLYLAGVQQWFSVVAGILVIIMAVLYFMHRGGIQISLMQGLYQRLSRLMGRLIVSRPRTGGFLLLGMANGLLPCGMVYIALAATVSFTHLYQAIGFMAMFGAGTLPAMMLAAYGGQFFTPSIKKSFRRAVPVFMTVAGLLLILRGLNLGIPFISPVLPSAAAPAVICH